MRTKDIKLIIDKDLDRNKDIRLFLTQRYITIILNGAVLLAIVLFQKEHMICCLGLGNNIK